MLDKRKVITYLTTCKRNRNYPKVRLVCGELQRIKTPSSVPERYAREQWMPMK